MGLRARSQMVGREMEGLEMRDGEYGEVEMEKVRIGSLVGGGK